jgi:flagellar assembly protein FliH
MLSKVLNPAPSDIRPVMFRRGGNFVAVPAADPQSALQAEITRLNSELAQHSRRDYENGFQAGQAAARKMLEAEVQGAVERLAASVADVAGARADTLRRAEEDTVRLAMEIARRVLHRELNTDPQALEALARAALEKLQSQEIIRVRVNPEQEPTLRRCLDQTGRGAAVEVVADPQQARGAAVFETARGTLDASVDTQLQEIERGLADQLGASR